MTTMEYIQAIRRLEAIKRPTAEQVKLKEQMKEYVKLLIVGRKGAI